MNTRNRNRWEAPAVVAGVLAVLTLALGQHVIAGLSVAVCVSLWDQSDRPRRTRAWQVLFVGAPIVLFGLAVWELALGHVAASILLAALCVGAALLAMFGHWGSRTQEADPDGDVWLSELGASLDGPTGGPLEIPGNPDGAVPRYWRPSGGIGALGR